MPSDRKIIYVNYSPYENSGKILDFLLNNFDYVFLFSVGFYFLGSAQQYNKLYIYKNKNLIKEQSLYQMPAPQSYVFFMLPLRSLLNFLQIFFYSFMLSREFGKIDLYFTVNGFTAWVGNVLKKFGIVKKTVYWVWDYYPSQHQDKIVALMRWLYWQFDRRGANSDKLVFLNQRLMDVWVEKKAISRNAGYLKVPIGTDIVPKLPKKDLKKIRVGFIGVLKKSQGVDMIFNSAGLLIENFPQIQFDLIGYGPDLGYFKKRALENKLKVIFHGLLDEPTFEKVLSACTIGIAPYIPEDNNVSRYGDPGKIKRYISFGLPTITTNVFEFAQELQESGAGIIIDYYKPQELVEAIRKINANYYSYQQNAIKLNDKFYFNKIYPKMFDFK